ncbi:rhodanese-like domain-containing protein [Methylobacillus flagellatus]|uniref:rhodanese-like domain-containing protein n=1 Tax=Methylobacillus flagellatus TaxID=405 RepID=UPI0010FA30B1|nr:rhodanese-like domain-containing protein [Methylobacillus flagellatus]
MSAYQEIEAEQLHQLLAVQKIQLVDVRNDDEVARGIIPGALHITLANIPMKHEALLSEDVPLVFYCHSGIRSAHAASFLASKGREQVYNLRGGVLAWGKAGYAFGSK